MVGTDVEDGRRGDRRGNQGGRAGALMATNPASGLAPYNRRMTVPASTLADPAAVVMAPVNTDQADAGPGFVHLRLRSEYSVLDSIVRIDEAVAAAVDDGQPALALSDASNLFGWVKFYRKAAGQGVQPICAADV